MRERMSAVDTAWLRMDSAKNLMMIVGVYEFDGKVDFARLRDLLGTRLVTHRRFRSRVVRDATGYYWQEIDDFDLNDHLVRSKLPGRGMRTYSAANQHVGLYVGYYRSQRQGDTIHSPMNCLPGAGWVPVDAGRSRIAAAGGGDVEVNRYLIQKGEDRQVALYWYEGRGRTVASEYWSKAYLVWDAASRNRTDGALVRVLSPVARGESTADAARRAEAFAARLLPLLPAYVPR